MIDLDDLIADARTAIDDREVTDSTGWFWVGRLAEAAESTKAERDAALAVIERVKETLSLHNPNGRLVKEVLAALDGAPEPEGVWEYRARTDYGRVVAQGSLDEIGHLSGHIWERRRKAGPWLPVEGESKP